MKLFKYRQFLGETTLNENLDKAKRFLKDTYLLTSAAKNLGFVEGELKAQLDNKEKRVITLGDFTPEQQAEIKLKLKELRLGDDEVRNIERNPDFLKIRELLGQKYIGWTYPFTYFYFAEMVSMEELFTSTETVTTEGKEVKVPNNIFSKLIDYSGLLDKLPKKFDANFIDPNIPNNAEVLIDGLDSLEDYRKIKKVIDKLTNVLKKDYSDSPEVIKGQFAEVARGFDQLGGKDEAKKEKLWKSFFGEIRTIESDQVIHGKSYKKGDKRYFGPLSRYKNIREFIKAAQNYLKSSENETILAFYDKINTCNEKYGTQGADTVYEENGILIIEVKSFQANQFLNGHTRHCIKDYSSQWESYVSSHNNKQYYIYNFNIPQYDNYSTIGITIQPGQSIRACHAKDDANIMSSIKGILKKFESEYDIKDDIFAQLKPMTDEEIRKRERAKIAEREIVKKGLSIDQIKQYVKEDGANINKDNCVALLHAVEENNYEKSKVILELGGSPNLRSKADAIINKAQDLNMIKLLVSNGSELTGEVFNNICNELEAVEYCLKQGLDPNFDNSLPIRRCCKGGWKSKDDIGEGYYDVFLLLVKYGAKLADEGGRNMAIKWAAEYGRLNFIDYMLEKGVKSGFKSALSWLKHSRKIPDDKKAITIAYLEDKIKEYGDV
jgi:ankyrin repeat protein